MVIFQHRAKRKNTGGAYKRMIVKRQYMMGNEATLTKLGTRSIKTERAMGGIQKQRLLVAETANVYDPKTKKYTQAKISTVIENASNRNFARRNVMTKGTVIETSAGKARITSRPGQEGAINAVLV